MRHRVDPVTETREGGRARCAAENDVGPRAGDVRSAEAPIRPADPAFLAAVRFARAADALVARRHVEAGEACIAAALALPHGHRARRLLSDVRDHLDDGAVLRASVAFYDAARAAGLDEIGGRVATWISMRAERAARGAA